MGGEFYFCKVNDKQSFVTPGAPLGRVAPPPPSGAAGGRGAGRARVRRPARGGDTGRDTTAGSPQRNSPLPLPPASNFGRGDSVLLWKNSFHWQERGSWASSLPPASPPRGRGQSLRGPRPRQARSVHLSQGPLYFCLSPLGEGMLHRSRRAGNKQAALRPAGQTAALVPPPCPGPSSPGAFPGFAQLLSSALPFPGSLRNRPA